LFLPLANNLRFSRSDDEEPPTCATAVSPPSPVATDEPVEPYVAPRTTRASVKKVSQTQARALKRTKKTKEVEVSLEAHASTVSSDDVSYPGCFSFLSFHVLLFLHSSFYQALVKRFIALGTECAGYLKVAKASEGAILSLSHYSAFMILPCPACLTSFCLLFVETLATANARVVSLEAELKASQKAYDAATAAKAAAEKSQKSALARAKKAEKALADSHQEHAQREQAVAERLHTMSAAAESKLTCLLLSFPMC
jgi:hypothetical protein